MIFAVSVGVPPNAPFPGMPPTMPQGPMGPGMPPPPDKYTRAACTAIIAHAHMYGLILRFQAIARVREKSLQKLQFQKIEKKKTMKKKKTNKQEKSQEAVKQCYIATVSRAVQL